MDFKAYDLKRALLFNFKRMIALRFSDRNLTFSPTVYKKLTLSYLLTLIYPHLNFLY